MSGCRDELDVPAAAILRTNLRTMKHLLAAFLAFSLALFPLGASAGARIAAPHGQASHAVAIAHDHGAHGHAKADSSHHAYMAGSMHQHAAMDGPDQHQHPAKAKPAACGSNCCDMACHALQTVEPSRLAERNSRSLSATISVATLALSGQPFGIERPPRHA
jgi:hypothetical protein